MMGAATCRFCQLLASRRSRRCMGLVDSPHAPLQSCSNQTESTGMPTNQPVPDLRLSSGGTGRHLDKDGLERSLRRDCPRLYRQPVGAASRIAAQHVLRAGVRRQRLALVRWPEWRALRQALYNHRRNSPAIELFRVQVYICRYGKQGTVGF
jgi:hypothetical protein